MDNKGYTLNSKNNKKEKRVSKSSKTSSIESKENLKEKKYDNKSSINESNNPPPKNGNNRISLKDKIKLRLDFQDIIYENEENKEYKSPKEGKNKKNKIQIQNINSIFSEEKLTDNNYGNENQKIENPKKLNKFRKFNKVLFNNLKTDLESNEILNENKNFNFKKHTNSDKEILKHINLEKLKERNKEAILKKKENIKNI
jgi:hypothetical protein